MNVLKRIAVLLALLLLVALPAVAGADGVADFTVTPGDIPISTFYNGTSLHLAGTVPDGCQVVARFTGAPENVAMKQKGKALGLLWMNMNTLHFEGVPKVFLEATSAPLEELGPAGSQLGLDGLAESIGIEPATADRAMLLPELIKLKQHEKLYRVEPGAIRLGAAEGGVRRFEADLAIPSRLSPGSYAVEVYAVQGGAVAAQAQQPVDARLTGMPAFMADLAFNHSVWYGVLASLIAIFAGLGIGLVFQSKGAH